MDIISKNTKNAIDLYIQSFMGKGAQPNFSTKINGEYSELSFDTQRVTVEDVIKNENNFVLLGNGSENLISVSLKCFNDAIANLGLTCHLDAGNPGVKPEDLHVVTFESLNASNESLANIPKNLLKRERSID